MKTKFIVFDREVGDFLQPEINGIPFDITQDGCAYQLELKHPAFIMCEYAGLDKKKQQLFEGDIVEVRSTITKEVTNRNVIMKDKCCGTFFVMDRAPGPCRVPMCAVSMFYTKVGNIHTKTGPQEIIFECQ